jgi:WXG100 family type VII secretion target
VTQIHSDSDALRSFANEVSSFARAVDEELGRLRAAMGRLGDTWEDDGYKKFSDEFTRTQHRVKQLMEDARVMKLELTQRADVLDAYSRSG